jgi:hypothetical protein
MRAQVLTWLLSVPGASKTVLEARIPYGGGKSMAEILAREPVTYACTLTAVEMARAAYRQAAHLSEFGVPILGVSCTCALATDRVKRGDHKARLIRLSCASTPGPTAGHMQTRAQPALQRSVGRQAQLHACMGAPGLAWTEHERMMSLMGVGAARCGAGVCGSA